MKEMKERNESTKNDMQKQGQRRKKASKEGRIK